MAQSAQTKRLKRFGNVSPGQNNLKPSTRTLMTALRQSDGLHKTWSGGSMKKLKRMRKMQAAAYKKPIAGTRKELSKRLIGMQRKYLTGK